MRGGRYLPPARRHTQEAIAESTQEQRSLDGVQQTSDKCTLRLDFGQLDAAELGCPLDVDVDEAPGVYTVHDPDSAPEELMDWLASSFPTGARLEFPPTLSKMERARWHRIAERHGLHSQSMGMGSARFLAISPAGGGQGEEGPSSEGTAAQPALTAEQQQRVKQLYKWCQEEGGEYWAVSVGELREMVGGGQVLPAALQKLEQKMCVRMPLPCLPLGWPTHLYACTTACLGDGIPSWIHLQIRATCLHVAGWMQRLCLQ